MISFTLKHKTQSIIPGSKKIVLCYTLRVVLSLSLFLSLFSRLLSVLENKILEAIGLILNCWPLTKYHLYTEGKCKKNTTSYFSKMLSCCHLYFWFFWQIILKILFLSCCLSEWTYCSLWPLRSRTRHAPLSQFLARYLLSLYTAFQLGLAGTGTLISMCSHLSSQTSLLLARLCQVLLT